MVDWQSAAGARRGHDLEREQAEALEEESDDWSPDVVDDRFGIHGRQADRVADVFDSLGDLLARYRDGEDLMDHDGIGETTSKRIHDWVRDHYPALRMARFENDEAYCTEFTLDHGIDEEDLPDDEIVWAFICPRDGAINPLAGHPSNFRNLPYACRECRWVSLLTAEFLDEWLEEADVPPDPDDLDAAVASGGAD